MPIFEFQCIVCGASEEAIIKYTEIKNYEETHKCTACGSKTRYKLAGANFTGKGEGWYGR